MEEETAPPKKEGFEMRDPPSNLLFSYMSSAFRATDTQFPSSSFSDQQVKDKKNWRFFLARNEADSAIGSKDIG